MFLAFLDKPAVIYIIEFFVGLTSIGGFLYKNKSSKDGMSKKDLLSLIEEKDRQIERLTIMNHAHRMRLKHLKEQHQGNTCN